MNPTKFDDLSTRKPRFGPRPVRMEFALKIWHWNGFSSFYCASVANAPNVLQPYWLIVLTLDVPDLTASLLL